MFLFKELFFLLLCVYQNAEASTLLIYQNSTMFTIKYVPDVMEKVNFDKEIEAIMLFYETPTESEAYRLLGRNVSYPYRDVTMNWNGKEGNEVAFSASFEHNKYLTPSWWMVYNIYVNDGKAIRYGDTDNVCEFLWEKTNSSYDQVAYGNCTKHVIREVTSMGPIQSERSPSSTGAITAIIVGVLVGVLFLGVLIAIIVYIIWKNFTKENRRWGLEAARPELPSVVMRQIEVTNIVPEEDPNEPPPDYKKVME
ncbi:uncharacterized protein [Watersipora subatra]|uniref:uncharacterized protein n=1 Tax=Watersipora subatra TaxID=2589382 RepID=UPI00355ADDEA